MKASELRIGNWILNTRYKSGYEMQIESIGEFGLNVELGYDGLNPIIDDDCGFNECEPIPLTEEWLLKFGFIRHHYDYANDVIYIKNVVDNTEFEWGVYPNELGSGIQIMNRKKLKYVHQLQNLYFALTNEELYESNTK